MTERSEIRLYIRLNSRNKKKVLNWLAMSFGSFGNVPLLLKFILEIQIL